MTYLQISHAPVFKMSLHRQKFRSSIDPWMIELMMVEHKKGCRGRYCHIPMTTVLLLSRRCWRMLKGSPYKIYVAYVNLRHVIGCYKSCLESIPNLAFTSYLSNTYIFWLQCSKKPVNMRTLWNAYKRVSSECHYIEGCIRTPKRGTKRQRTTAPERQWRDYTEICWLIYHCPSRYYPPAGCLSWFQTIMYQNQVHYPQYDPSSPPPWWSASHFEELYRS